MNHTLVRGSEVSSFLRCRQQWKWAWVDQIRPKRQEGKLWLGTLFHRFVEMYYYQMGTGIDPSGAAYVAMLDMFEKTDKSRMEQTQIDEVWDMALKITTNYVNQWADHTRGWQVIATELRFAIPLDDEIAYEGTIDLIFKDEDGHLWFSDHKTTTSIDRYVKNAEMDRQISRYWWSLQQLAQGKGWLWEKHGEKEGWFTTVGSRLWQEIDGLQPHGFIYNIIAKDWPEPPAVLKKGGLSKAMNQKTTLDMYLKAMLDNGLLSNDTVGNAGLVPEEYADIITHLKNQESEDGNRYFRRIKVFRRQDEVDAAMADFREVVADITSNPRIYRNINYDCSSMCQFHSLCVATLDGSNADMLINLMYEKGTNTNGELPGEDA